jgi:predicted 3-demethylubiquinone-9 3-methyltransferase (glyoxalase superfamily)
MSKIIPFLWYDKAGEEAAKFYVGVFNGAPDAGKNSKVGKVVRYGKEGQEVHGQKPGSVMTAEFTLDGQNFVALNGGPVFKFTEAISLSIACESQEEVDYFWEKLRAGGGQESVCGWLKDKYGLSWQVNPRRLGELLADPDRKKADRVMKAMLKMKKIDIEGLERAYKEK